MKTGSFIFASPDAHCDDNFQRFSPYALLISGRLVDFDGKTNYIF